MAPAAGGMSGSVSTRTANQQAERVTASGQLRLPSCWSAEPVKSRVSSSPAIVAVRRSSRSSSSAASSTSRASMRRRPRARSGRRACAARRSPRSRPSRRAGRRAPSRSRSSTSRFAPVRLAASWARRSARRCAGWRISDGEPLDRVVVEPLRGDHHALVLERAWSRPASSPGVGPPTSAWWARLAAKPSSSPSSNTGVIDGDVGQVGAAGERVVEHPRRPGGVVLADHRRDRGGHRAEVDRDVLGLHDHLALGVEQRARGVAALLDVGRVRGLDQHRAHLLAGGAQGRRTRPAA